MFSNSFFAAITQSFIFRKVVPGILIGLLAMRLDSAGSSDVFTFVLSMVVFWAAIGVGHGLAQLTTGSES
jgi:hypothetical protein